MMFVGAMAALAFWATLMQRKAKRDPYAAVDLTEMLLQAVVFVLAGAVAGYALEYFL